MTALTFFALSAAAYATVLVCVMVPARWLGTSRLLWGEQPRSVRMATAIGGGIAAVPAGLALLELLS